jgi:hypothetical protein
MNESKLCIHPIADKININISFIDPDWSCRCVAMMSINEEESNFFTAEEACFFFNAEQNFAAFSNARIEVIKYFFFN